MAISLNLPVIVIVPRNLAKESQFWVRFRESVKILQFSTTEEELYLFSVILVSNRFDSICSL
jgi:hypothetical protein